MTDHGECHRNPAKKTKQKSVLVESEVLPPNAPKFKAHLTSKKTNIFRKQKLPNLRQTTKSDENFASQS